VPLGRGLGAPPRPPLAGHGKGAPTGAGQGEGDGGPEGQGRAPQFRATGSPPRSMTPALAGWPDRGPVWWSIRELRDVRSQRRLRAMGGLWIAALAFSVGTGILNVSQGWNGIPVEVFGVVVDVTIYPPFVVSVLAALWLGPVWGGIPIYLANLASALTSGLPFPMSALFAIAGVIETLMLWGSMVTLKVDPELRRRRDVAWFAGASLVAASTGSLAAILWNASHGLDPIEAQRVWRGWIIGDLVQLLFVVGPLLRLLGPRASAWIDTHFVTPPTREFSYTHGVGLVTAAFATLGAVVFLGVHQALASIQIAFDTRTATGDLLLPRLREIILVMGLLSTALIVATGMFSTALARMGERQRREAVVDGLTGCLNRRSFDDQFRKESERSRRLGRGIGVLFLDLDRFKTINDEQGHAVGDLMLVSVARRIEEALRSSDLLFRWGGEEFVALLPHTSATDAVGIGERVRAAVGDRPFTHHGGQAFPMTVSVGVAAADPPPGDPNDLLQSADGACYEAKRSGRNRTVPAAAA
jgi:diguanylate cyclase (GGDEF)-like protein